MNERYPAQLDEEPRKASVPLAERMDPAIGEATSVMSAMMSELLRRTLRGGVMKIGEELDVYVHEKVDETIEDRRPVIENLAIEVAEKSARIAATEVATEEVRTLETKTQALTQDLTVKIEETARTAQQTTVETARELTGRIEETGRQSQQATQETAQRLTGQIEETEKRVHQTFQVELTRHVQDIVERARKGRTVVETRLQAMEDTAAGLGKQLLGEQNERRTAENVLRQELARARKEGQAQLLQEVGKLVQANEALQARVVELEKPHGLWAWVRGLFGKRKKPAASEAAEDE